ncbi:MAG: hypothetical protein AAF488_12625, partial [Planctomycetota bacterium]
DAIAVFTKAIVQSIALGTSIASTLQDYAREMSPLRSVSCCVRAMHFRVREYCASLGRPGFSR